MDGFRKALAEEATFKMSDELVDRFLAPMEELRFSRGEAIVKSGEVTPDI